MIIDLKEKNMDKIKKGDLFVYNGKQIEPISIETLLKPLLDETKGLKSELSTLKQGLTNHDSEFKRLNGKLDKFINIFRMKRGNE